MKNVKVSAMTRCAVMLGAATASVMAPAQGRLPIYQVSSPLVTPGAAAAMNKQLGAAGLLDAQSVFKIDERAKVQLVPQNVLPDSKEDEDEGERLTLGLDLAAFKAIKPWSREDALNRTLKALQAGGISLPGGKAIVSESQLSLRDKGGKEIATRGLETIVSYQMSLEGVPLTGPGFKTRFAFAPSGALTQGHVFGWNLKRGITVDLISASDALKQAQLTLGDKARLSARLVYFAPSSDFQPKYIYPHYEVSGTMQVGDQVVPLRKLLLPAVKDGLSAAIDVQASGDVVSARPLIKGGRAPYKMQWSSATTDLVKSGYGDGSIQYQIDPRRGAEPVQESLRLIVTDADGQQVVAKATPILFSFSGISATYLMANTAPKPAPKAKVRQPGRYDGAIEWIDWTNNATNCRNEMNARGLPVQFFWGEMNAWEQDFKKESIGGDDSDWVDDVDITFYTGHANGDGFVFKSAMDDDFLHFNDASWGEREAEWIVIAACGPLQPTEGGRGLDRWLPAFQGLHILMGYGNISYDSSQEGSKFMNRILRNNSPMRVRDAWISTASEEQPSDVLMGLMGVVRDDWAWNWDDYFWGKGPVGPDIPQSRVIAYWYYVVPC